MLTKRARSDGSQQHNHRPAKLSFALIVNLSACAICLCVLALWKFTAMNIMGVERRARAIIMRAGSSTAQTLRTPCPVHFDVFSHGFVAVELVRRLTSI